LSDRARECPKIVPLSTANIFARAILSIHREDSISSLFEIHF
jgi:phosphoribosylpyrophosphate synthetase